MVYMTKIPHSYYIWKEYVRRFKDTDVFEKIFMRILETSNRFRIHRYRCSLHRFYPT